ncbi:GGDEF domain-containing protein [Alteromonas sp. ASW11-19]|uniref:diguanylate cyclase n=1 Tax=Alteromonas salexigens TaxID=2982530 RepID=A0ABT2VLL8_9ALTE|nr:sensor domain-containing diguanylate cyclase [Alteromonas salexigens]MCU7553318.1 GGDEF domain-containing protein [Alteromonas salexigens]
MTRHRNQSGYRDNLNIQPGRGQYLTVAASALVIIAISVLSVIYGQLPGEPSGAFLGAYGTAVVMLETFSAILLFAQFRKTGHLTFGLLAMAYLWVALIAPFQVALLAGAFNDVAMIATSPSTAAWLWTFWHLGFPIFIALAMLLNGRAPVVISEFGSWSALLLGGTLVLAFLAIVPTLFGWFEFPSLLQDTTAFSATLLDVIGPLNIGLCLTALAIIVIKGRFNTGIYAWLVIALLAATCEGMVAIYSGSRFSLGWYAARILSLISSSAVFFALLVETIQLYHKIMQQNETLYELASTDSLSGLANRRAFDLRLNEELRRSKRSKSPLSLILLDVDNFKQFNDRHGHNNGDHCIRHIGKTLTTTLSRETDFPARVGGEEFAVVLPGSDSNDAQTIAERIRHRIAETSVQLDDGSDVYVSASIGVTTVVPKSRTRSSTLLKQADKALYAAKAAGKNCIRTAQKTLSVA